MCSLSNSVVGGGLIVFDDYNTVYGTTVSLDNFESKHKLKIEKLSFSNTPIFTFRRFETHINLCVFLCIITLRSWLIYILNILYWDSNLIKKYKFKYIW